MIFVWCWGVVNETPSLSLSPPPSSSLINGLYLLDKSQLFHHPVAQRVSSSNVVQQLENRPSFSHDDGKKREMRPGQQKETFVFHSCSSRCRRFSIGSELLKMSIAVYVYVIRSLKKKEKKKTDDEWRGDVCCRRAHNLTYMGSPGPSRVCNRCRGSARYDDSLTWLPRREHKRERDLICY